MKHAKKLWALLLAAALMLTAAPVTALAAASIWDTFRGMNSQPYLYRNDKVDIVGSTESPRPVLATGTVFYFLCRTSGGSNITTAGLEAPALSVDASGLNIPIASAEFVYATASGENRWLVKFTVGDLSTIPAGDPFTIAGSIVLSSSGVSTTVNYTFSADSRYTLRAQGTGSGTASIWDTFRGMNVQPYLYRNGQVDIVTSGESPRPQLAAGSVFYYLCRTGGNANITASGLTAPALVVDDSNLNIPIASAEFVYAAASGENRWLVKFTVGDLNELPAGDPFVIAGSIMLSSEGVATTVSYTFSTSSQFILYAQGTGEGTEYDIGITAPVARATPDTVAALPTDATFTAGAVSWSPADPAFADSTAYTATEVLTADTDTHFLAFDSAKVAGASVSRTFSADYRAMTVTAAFPATGVLRQVQSIATGIQADAGSGIAVTDRRQFDFGDTVYFALAYASGSYITAPDYILPAAYALTTDSEQVESLEFVRARRSDGNYRWYLAVTLMEETEFTYARPVTGTVTATPQDGSAFTLSLTARGMVVGEGDPPDFTRISNWAQLKSEDDGYIRSISGAGTSSPVIPLGVNEIYYALYYGSTAVADPEYLINTENYTVEYIPDSDNPYPDPIIGAEVVHETWSSGDGSNVAPGRLFVRYDIDPNRTELGKSMGTTRFFNAASQRIASSTFDPERDSAALPPIFDGEDTLSLDGKVDRSQCIAGIDTTLNVEYNGVVGPPGSLGIATNVDFGETAYFPLYGISSMGTKTAVTSYKYVEDAKIATAEFLQGLERIDSFEIVKRISYTGVARYYLAVNIVALDHNTRYTIAGTVKIKKAGKYGVDGDDHEVKGMLEFVAGRERGAVGTSTGNRYDFNERRLDRTPRRFDFGSGGERIDDMSGEAYSYTVGGDEEDVIYLYGMSDDNYFTVNTVNQGTIVLANNVDYVPEVCDQFPDAELWFFNGNGKSFHKFGILTLSAPEGWYVYERSGASLKRVSGQCSYDEDEGAFKIRTKTLGSYVISDTLFPVDKWAISSMATWPQEENADYTISVITGASSGAAYLSYGQSMFITLKGPDGKDITGKGALDPSLYTCVFEPMAGYPNPVTDIRIAWRTHYAASSGKLTNKYFLKITFAEVPDPGVIREIRGTLRILYEGEEIASFDMTSDEHWVVLFGGHVVENGMVLPTGAESQASGDGAELEEPEGTGAPQTADTQSPDDDLWSKEDDGAGKTD